MTRFIELLKQKNHYLEKFYSANEEEMLNFNIGNFDTIEAFYQTREKILEVIRYIDFQIKASDPDLPPIPKPGEQSTAEPEVRRLVREQLAIKDEYVSRIVKQDLEILGFIERAKSEIIKELLDLRKGRRAMSGYRSRQFGHRLNEEA